ncbi:MAG: hypothetical protein JXQ90_18050 [Cyclobacteriaceae bacterium]
MDEFKNSRKPLRGAFPRSLQDNKEERSAPSNVYANPRQFYAIASENELVKRFKLFLRSGRTYSVPYSLLPVFILLEGKKLVIKTYGIHIAIEGRNLAVLEEYLSDELLLWVKESPGGKDDGKSHVFVSDIYIQGKAIKHTEDTEND